MNVLVVGFGNMGCRHVQAFLHDLEYNVFVVEPDNTIFKVNLERIGGDEDMVSRISLDECLNGFFDFAVIATSANVRFDLLKTIIGLGIKGILLEKVVFQSISQFDEALKLIVENDVKVYCNFLNRYSKSYRKIKEEISDGSKINFTVTGGQWGFACNALHYIDLFKYLTGSNVSLVKSNLVKSDEPNSRGHNFVEVYGQQVWETERGDKLFISSDAANTTGRGTEGQISIKDLIHYIDENTFKYFVVGGVKKLEIRNFDTPMASKLTKTLFKEITLDVIQLPDVRETMHYHLQFFEAINECLGLKKSDLCPIT